MALPPFTSTDMTLICGSICWRQRHSKFLFNFTYVDLLAAVREAASALGAAALRVTPHCFRHGGASHDRAVRARTLPEIQRRGMWASPNSVRRYDKHGRIGLQWMQLAEQDRLLIEELAGRAPLLFSRTCALP